MFARRSSLPLMIAKHGLVLALAVLLVACLGEAASACPTCKDSIAGNDPQMQGEVKGYFYSILFMMAMPFLLLGTIGGMAMLSIRKARLSAGKEHAAVINGKPKGLARGGASGGEAPQPSAG